MTRRRIDTEIQKRGYVWKCQTSADKKRFIANGETKKEGCGYYNAYFGRKWAATKGDARWQGICKHCEGSRKRQLNLGNVIPEPPQYYESREAAQAKADQLNSEIDNPKAEYKSNTTRWL